MAITNPPDFTINRILTTRRIRTPRGWTSNRARRATTVTTAPDRLATMWATRPAKAIMNGEPTYENSGRMGKAVSWWQGNEAWINVCAGATLGIGYGAASLWQWRIHAGEPGHPSFYLSEDSGWREALDFEGSRYVGLVGRILAGLDLSEAEPCWDVCQRTRGLLVPGRLFVCSAEHGGRWGFLNADDRVADPYGLIEPRTGEVTDSGTRPRNYGVLPGEGGGAIRPHVLRRDAHHR